MAIQINTGQRINSDGGATSVSSSSTSTCSNVDGECDEYNFVGSVSK